MRHPYPHSAAVGLSALSALALAFAFATPGVAAPNSAPPGPPPPRAGTPTTLAEHLVTPLSLAVTANGTLHVGQSFAGILTRTDRTGTSVVAAATPGAALDGVSESRGVLTWGEREGDEQSITSSHLVTRAADGSQTSIDVLAWEQAHNPDSVNTYGFESISGECAAQLPDFIPPSYTGGEDTHVYGTTTTGSTLYVADAGMNAVLKVDSAGTVSTVAVLPPQRVTITPEMLNGEVPLPECAVGLVYDAEPVPTDVAVGTDGLLYVTTLPGVPGLGAPFGSVYRIDPATGATALLATGFSGATGVAVAPNGTVFVAELFGNRISSITPRGKVSTFVEVDAPAAVQWSAGKLVATVGALVDGSVVSYPIR